MKAALTTAIFLILIIIVTAGQPRVHRPFQRVQICTWTTISVHRNDLQGTAFLVLWCVEASLPFGGFGAVRKSLFTPGASSHFPTLPGPGPGGCLQGWHPGPVAAGWAGPGEVLVAGGGQRGMGSEPPLPTSSLTWRPSLCQAAWPLSSPLGSCPCSPPAAPSSLGQGVAPS